MLSKQDLRQYLKDKRKMHRSNPIVLGKSHIDHLMTFDFLSTDKKVGSFMALPEEVDLRIIHDYCLEKGIELSFPVLQNDEIAFMRVNDLSTLKENAFGIKEPVFDRQMQTEPDVFFVPGFGFDRRGNRLGFGKGHYDKYFATIDAPSKIKIGVCQDTQVSRYIPSFDHDVKMNFVLSERRVINQDGLIFWCL